MTPELRILVHDATKDRLNIPPPKKPVDFYALAILVSTSHLNADGGCPSWTSRRTLLGIERWTFEGLEDCGGSGLIHRECPLPSM